MATVTFQFVPTAEPDMEDDEYKVFVDGVERREYSIQSGAIERYFVANRYFFKGDDLTGAQEIGNPKTLAAAKALIIAEIEKETK